MAVCPSKARAAPPFQLCHHLVPGDISGSVVHTISAKEKGGISLYWLLLEATLALPELDPNEEDPGHSGPCLFSPGLTRKKITGLLSPALIPGVQPKSYWPPSSISLDPPASSSPPTKVLGKDNFEKLGPTIPIGHGHFLQTEL